MKKITQLAFSISSSILMMSLVPNAFAGDAAKGKEVYDVKGACATCHGATGKGDGAAAAAMNPKPRSFADGQFAYDTDGDGKTGTDADLLNILKNGTAPYGGSATMFGRADMTDAELADMVAYIRTLKN